MNARSISFAAASVCAALALVTAPAPGTESLKPRIDQIVKPYVEAQGGFFAKKPRVVGMTIGIVHGGQQTVFGYGTVDADRAEVPNGDTVYEIGSITKVFTGILLAEAARKHELELIDPISKYLPAEVTRGRPHSITLLDLATHTSGLSSLPSNLNPKDMANPCANYGLDDLHAFLSGQDCKRKSRRRYSYSNLGVGLLAQLVARAADRSYEELLIERICAPLGMKDTRVGASEGMKPRLAIAYRKYGKKTVNADLGALVGAGGVSSTMNDMLLFLTANMGLRTTPLLPAMRDSHKEQVQVAKRMGMGLAWHLPRPNWAKQPVVFHNGQTAGYHAFMAFHEHSGVGVVILANTAVDIDPIGFQVLDLLANTNAPAAVAGSAHVGD